MEISCTECYYSVYYYITKTAGNLIDALLSEKLVRYTFSAGLK